MKRQVKKPQVISIQRAIDHLMSGGTYIPSREAVRLMATDPIEGQRAMQKEANDGAVRAMRYARTLIKKRQGNSKYVPHQGKKECLRRAHFPKYPSTKLIQVFGI